MNRLRCTLLKPNRRSRFYRLRYTLPGEFTERETSLGVKNKDVAEKLRLKFISEFEREACGLIPPKAQREAAVTDLRSLVDEYAADLHARKCGLKYVENSRRQILKPVEVCGWRTIGDVKSADFLRWRNANGKSSPRTLNLYLASINAFFAWLRQTERTEEDPLSRVKKVNGSRDIRRKRRALTDDEAARLLAVAPAWRRETYFLALWTGLRREELKSLTWGDVLLDAEPPRVVPRAAGARFHPAALVRGVRLLHQLRVRCGRRRELADPEPDDDPVPRPVRLRRVHHADDLVRGAGARGGQLDGERQRQRGLHAVRLRGLWLRAAAARLCRLRGADRLRG